MVEPALYVLALAWSLCLAPHAPDDIPFYQVPVSFVAGPPTFPLGSQKHYGYPSQGDVFALLQIFFVPSSRPSASPRDAFPSNDLYRPSRLHRVSRLQNASQRRNRFFAPSLTIPTPFVAASISSANSARSHTDIGPTSEDARTIRFRSVMTSVRTTSQRVP